MLEFIDPGTSEVQDSVVCPLMTGYDAAIQTLCVRVLGEMSWGCHGAHDLGSVVLRGVVKHERAYAACVSPS